jgi:SWI/SNF-related matrix-associated actin-dependent regulator of chromatin subfamily A3
MRRGSSYSLLFNSHYSIRFDSIPFVRFDGQMSVKRRRDAINRFGVSLEQEQSIFQRRNARNEPLTSHDDDSCDSDSMVIDDHDFINDDDGQVFGKKSKCKGKGKATDARSGSADGGENPRVMLLSLKAVCCFQIIKIS